GYRMVAGDFNGDGKSDIAMTGAAGATTIPVAFSGVAVNLHLSGFYGSVSIRVNGSLTGTCNVADCLYIVPVGSTVQLTPDGDVTSWGSGSCQNVAGSASCFFTAQSDNTFHVNFLG
ncbi:hypothetical protein, partial [Streptosporangium roseum]|uniref:hypothetical protein n=1 Tax=Streptosporangium roseum TaxID=2001 RepID=UPI00332E89D2